MKKMIVAAALCLLTVRVAQAGDYDFKSYSFANYGSPFYYVPTTADDLTTALNGGAVNQGGYPGGTLDEVLQAGPTSVSDDYDVGGGLHVTFSASSAFHPAEPLSNAAPGIGGKVVAANNQNPGAATVIGESYVYLKDTVSINNPTALAYLTKSYEVGVSLDGVVHVSGDAIALVGEAIRITLDDGFSYTTSDMHTFQPGLLGLSSYFNFGQPGQIGDPLSLTNPGPYGTELVAHGSNSMTIETLLYLRAQTGGQQRGAGTAEVDFSHTLKVSNIKFFDENGQVIPDLQIVGSNGDAYPYNAVPEPSTLALFVVGSLGLWLAQFRRVQRS